MSRSTCLSLLCGLLLCGHSPAQALFSRFGETRLPLHQDNTYALDMGDVNGDGHLDLVCGNMGAPDGQNRLYLGDGRGGFVDVTAANLPLDLTSTQALALGDVDGDGDLDLVGANYVYPSGRHPLWLNDGSGRFVDVTARSMPLTTYPCQALALGDVDGDGDLDLVFGSALGINTLLRNDGKGVFTDVTAGNLPALADNTLALALADVDGDGDLDLVCGNQGQNRLYLGDGTGIFRWEPGRLPALVDRTTCLALGDVDGDGDPDLLCGNSGTGGGESNRLYLNDGRGRFVDGTTLTMGGGAMTWSVALGDVDGDGDPDLVWGNSGPNRLLINQGGGLFRDASPLLADEGDLTYGLALGDVDGDGDLDLVCGNTNVPFIPENKLNRLYLNLTRQIHGSSPLQVGGRYDLDLYTRDPLGMRMQVVLPMLSPGAGSTVMAPMGVLGLDPAGLVALAPVLILPLPGQTRLSFLIPADPGLVGTGFHLQGLHIPDLALPGSSWRFTNLLRERID